MSASDGDGGRCARLPEPMTELRDERRVVNLAQDDSNRRPGISRKYRRVSGGREMAGALRSNETEWTLRCGLLPVARCRPVCCNAAQDKTRWARRRSRRHAEPDACHHRLDGERIRDISGQKAAARLRPNKLSQVSHRKLLYHNLRAAAQDTVKVAITAAEATAAEGRFRAIEELVAAAAMIGAIGPAGEVFGAAMIAKSLG